MIAPITKWKMPSVRQVIGAETSSMIGLMNALTIPRTRPVRSREMYLSASPKPYDAFPQVIPGTKKAATAMATALISARQMIRTAETLNQYWASIPRRRIVSSARPKTHRRSEEHTSELQSQSNLVCRLLLEKKNHRIDTRLIGSER